MMDDHELLRAFVRERSQEAFRELVDRHLPMVFACAQRLTRDARLAEEIAQGVFATLARKAESLTPPQVVGGWLYNVTRHLALHAVRSEQRRREREQAAIALQTLENSPEPTNRIAGELEPLMAELEAADRDALVLRYLENRSLREVGAELGVSEDAARMRVNRALEKLRALFERKGIGVTSAALLAAIAAGNATAVPAGLGASITTTAIAGTAAATTTILTKAAITSTMSWINTKAVVGTVGAALVAGTGAYLAQQRQIDRLREENKSLAAQQKILRTRHDAELADARKAGTDELERLKKELADLPRLRGEVTRLRQQVEEDKQALARQQQPSQAANPTKPVAETIWGNGSKPGFAVQRAASDREQIVGRWQSGS